MSNHQPDRSTHHRSVTLAAALLLGGLYIGATLPTPLYPLYRRGFGFSGLTLTLIYAVYVLGNLSVLMVFGRISDQVGRRRAVAPALLAAAASTLVFLFASSTAWLFPARLLSGVATGLGSGALTAWIADAEPEGGGGSGARIATAANFLGLAVGALLSGAVAQWAAAPLRLPYIAYLALLAVALLLTLRTPETARPEGGALSLRPRLRVPHAIWRDFLPNAIGAFVVFALIGFYAALLPSLLAERLHMPDPVIAGAVVCGLFVIAAIAVAATGRLHGETALGWGLIAMIPALLLLVGADAWRSFALMACAAIAGGAAAALGYRGSLAEVNRIAPADRRSEVISAYLIAVYAGNALPVIGVGLLAGLTTALVAHLLFAGLLGLLSLTALILRRRAA